MTETPIFSIIVPTRNRPSFLPEAIRSVFGQSSSGWEVVIVDDHSSPPVSQTLSNRLLNDERVHLLTNEEHKGVGHSRNRGLGHAKGAWIVFLDDDDEIEPDFLKHAREAVANLPPDRSLIMPCKMHPRSQRISWSYHTMKLRTRENAKIAQRDRHNFHLLMQSPPQMPSMICRKDVLLNYLFEEGLAYGEDLLLWARLVHSGLRFETISEKGQNSVLIRQHGQAHLSAGTSEDVSRYFRALEEQFNSMDIRTVEAIRAKRLARDMLQMRMGKAMGSLLQGMKRPRLFLGSVFYQIRFKLQTFVSFLFYRLFSVDL